VSTFLRVISDLLGLYSVILFVRAILSWFPQIDPYNPIIRFIHRITEPILAPIRAILPPLGGLDLSTFALILLIYFLRQALLSFR
jgi:YggT family protein